MRFYTQQHSFYWGIDLDARTMYTERGIKETDGFLKPCP